MSVILPIDVDTRARTYTAAGGETVFAVPFPFQANRDIRLSRVDVAGSEIPLAQPGDFTLTGAMVPSGGTATLKVPLAAGEKLIVKGAAVLDRLTTIKQQGAFKSKQVDDELDRNRIIQQEQGRDLARSLKVRPDAPPLLDLPPPAPGRALIGNPAGNGYENGPNAAEIASAQHWAEVALAAASGLQGNAGPTGIFDTPLLAAAYVPPAGAVPSVVEVRGFASPTDGGGAKYVNVGAIEPAHSGKFAMTDTGGGQSWFEIAAPVLLPEMFGQTGQADDYAVFKKWADTTRALQRPWMIRPGVYTLNGSGSIQFKTDGWASGAVIKIPKNNGTCRIEFLRDDPTGTVLDTSGWGTLARDATAVGATNAFGKTLKFISSEVLIERGTDPSVYSPYTKQEMQRCWEANGELATGLVHSYNDKSKLVVTAYTPCRPIRVVGLTIVRTGTIAAVNLNPSVQSYRDRITFDDLDISTENTASGHQGQGLVLVQCCDVVLNRPHIRGCDYDGTGYGVQAATTINTVYNNPLIYDCREAIAGRHNVDQTVNGGYCSPIIDDHWGDRMTVNDTVIKSVPGSCGVLYAGNDLTLNNVTMINGRQLVAIRVDTPQLGGSLIVNNPRVVSMNEDPAHGFFLIALSTPVGVTYSGAWTINPKLPDMILVNGGDIRVNTNSGLRYIVYLGSLYNRPHLPWGQVTVTGPWNLNGLAFTGIYYIKNSPDQLTRQSWLTVDGSIDFNGGNAIHATVFDNDSTRPAILRVDGPRNFQLRLHPLSFQHLEVENARMTSIVSLNTGASFAGSTHIRNTRMDGGAIPASWRNAAFVGCGFMGAYTDFPDIAYVTMLANYKNAAATGLPADIRANVVSPFS